MLGRAFAPIILAFTTACRGTGPSTEGTPEKRESPQASAQPAVLAVAPTMPPSATPGSTTEGGGRPPEPFRGDEVLSPDALSKENVGYTLSAIFRPIDVIGPPRAPEVNNLGLDAARRATELRLAIDLSPSRMRMTFLGHGFVLPPDTEVRARSDRYGHVVVWPGAASYRPLSPGSMRALVGERRFDVAPLTPAEMVLRDDVGRRIGIRTRKVEVTTRAAHASFEIGKLEGSADGGALLCRLLLDLMNAPPSTAMCTTDELPVRVELRWTNHGALVFELTGALRRTDIPPSSLLVPPPTASFAAAPLPAVGISPSLTGPELALFRTNDVDLPAAKGAPGAVGDELVVVNSTVELRMLFVDGVPIAWAAPGARAGIRGLRRGKYIAQWRTFLGDANEAPITLTVPGLVQVGSTPDGGH